MTPSPRISSLVLLVSCLAGCHGSTGTDAGPDSGATAADAGDGGSDAGGDAGTVCAVEGDGCDGVTVLCCDRVNDVCDPNQGICVLSVPDSGTRSQGPQSDGVIWSAEPISTDAALVALTALSVPSPAVQVAAGSGLGVGQLFLRMDGGWSALGGVPAALGFQAVWADPSGLLVAGGISDAGALLVLGSVNGGLHAVSSAGNPDAGPVASIFRGVFGLGPSEALAGGETPAGTAVALHVLPDGGTLLEALPPELTSIGQLTGGVDGGPLFALATPVEPDLPPWVLERSDGAWTELPEIFGAVNLAALSVGPSGTVAVAGDDGNGHGTVFVLGDGGFSPVATVPAIPRITAICEPVPGTYFVATATPTGQAAVYVSDGGLDAGTFWSEVLPATVQSIDAMASDSLGNVFAVGESTCSGCPGYPLALIRNP